MRVRCPISTIRGPERGWRKISTFRNPLFDLKGPTIFLDIDIVIVGNIDCLFSHPGEFIIIKDWARPGVRPAIRRFIASKRARTLNCSRSS